MANQRIQPDQLAKTIAGILDEYSEDVVNALNKETKKAAQDLRRATIAKAGGFGWKEYPGSIATKILRKSKYGHVYVWYVKSPHYRLSHLLEHGHAKVGSGGGRTKAFHFIRDSLAEVEVTYEKGARRAISAIK